MNMLLKRSLLGATALLLLPVASQAATCAGACGVGAANGDVSAPPSGTSYGWISTNNGLDGVGQIPGVGGTNGSTFTTSNFAANAGDSLKFNFNYVTSDGQITAQDIIYEDCSFAALQHL